MTKEQKIEWIEKADNEKLLRSFRWAVLDVKNATSIAEQIEAEEDYDMFYNELLKRLNK